MIRARRALAVGDGLGEPAGGGSEIRRCAGTAWPPLSRSAAQSCSGRVGDWDAGTFIGLGADAFAALPGVQAVAKSLKSGKAITKTIGTGAKLSTKTTVGVRRAGLTFLAETGGAGASDATKIFNYLGTKGAKVVGASEKAGQIAGKVLQGSVNLATQIPLVTEMATGKDMTEGKSTATNAALAANYSQTIGGWGAVGTAAQKPLTVSLALFGKVIGRR